MSEDHLKDKLEKAIDLAISESEENKVIREKYLESSNKECKGIESFQRSFKIDLYLSLDEMIDLMYFFKKKELIK